MPATVVIAGAGHGGFQAAASLRQAGFDGKVVLVGGEPGLPYQRPPLSKDYLAGTSGLDTLIMRPEAFYRDHDIELVAGARIAEIDRPGHQLRLATGARLAYDHLVLATGARNREPDLPGRDLAGICYLRTLAEADALRGRLAAARDIVVIGAGFIGLEFAAVAAAAGASIEIVEMMDRPMARVVTAATAAFFADYHRGAGVRLRFGAQAARLVGERGRVTAVELADGTRLPADLVVISVGVVPETDLARQAGLAVDNGVVVDSLLATADPAISAIGDCAVFPSRHADRAIRLESVQNATDHARCVVARLTGAPRPYDAVPWFWSDQGEQRLQIVGLTARTDATAIRGDVGSGAFSVFCFAGGALVGIESVNRPSDHAIGRRLIAGGRPITPDEAADPSFDLRAAATARPK